jgi:hypothetical protein
MDQYQQSVKAAHALEAAGGSAYEAAVSADPVEDFEPPHASVPAAGVRYGFDEWAPDTDPDEV